MSTYESKENDLRCGILDVQILIEYETEKHRGFAFIEFEAAENAAETIDNMNESESCTVRVNLAKPQRIKESSIRPCWADDTWLQKHAGKTVDELEAEAELERKAESKFRKILKFT